MVDHSFGSQGLQLVHCKLYSIHKQTSVIAISQNWQLSQLSNWHSWAPGREFCTRINKFCPLLHIYPHRLFIHLLFYGRYEWELFPKISRKPLEIAAATFFTDWMPFLLGKGSIYMLINGTLSHSYRVSLAIWDHTVLPVTQYKWTNPTLSPARQAGTQCTYPVGMEGWVDLVTGYIRRWFSCPQTVTHPSTNLAVHGRESNSQPVDYHYTTKPPGHPVCKNMPLIIIIVHLYSTVRS